MCLPKKFFDFLLPVKVRNFGDFVICLLFCNFTMTISVDEMVKEGEKQKSELDENGEEISNTASCSRH